MSSLSGFRQCVYFIHFIPGQLEIEQFRVFLNPSGIDGFWKWNDAVLQRPPQRSLSGSLSVVRTDSDKRFAVKNAPPAERRPALNGDIVVRTECERFFLRKTRVKFDLIDSRRNGRQYRKRLRNAAVDIPVLHELSRQQKRKQSEQPAEYSV